MWLLGVTLVCACSVYERPTMSGPAAGMAGFSVGVGGASGSDEGGGAAAATDSWGGQLLSVAAAAGQAGAGGDDGEGAEANEAPDTTGELAGSWGGDGQAGDGGAGGAVGSGVGSGAAGGTSCAAGWRDQTACDECATQTQPDLQACAVILDCYVSKSCGPSSCAGTDQKCGPNVLREGSAAYQIAQNVYSCICR